MLVLTSTRCGEIKRLVMGLDRFQKTPCGFCFVEYYTHQDALDCMKYIGGTKLDERVIRTDLDEGFAEGRQYGRGKSGGQVRDEYRDEYDPGRGGYGRVYADEYDELSDGDAKSAKEGDTTAWKELGVVWSIIRFRVLRCAGALSMLCPVGTRYLTESEPVLERLRSCCALQ